MPHRGNRGPQPRPLDATWRAVATTPRRPACIMEYIFRHRDSASGMGVVTARELSSMLPLRPTQCHASQRHRHVRGHASHEGYTVFIFIIILIIIKMDLIPSNIIKILLLGRRFCNILYAFLLLLYIETSQVPCRPLPLYLLHAGNEVVDVDASFVNYYVCIRPVPAHIHIQSHSYIQWNTVLGPSYMDLYKSV